MQMGLVDDVRTFLSRGKLNIEDILLFKIS